MGYATLIHNLTFNECERSRYTIFQWIMNNWEYINYSILFINQKINTFLCTVKNIFADNIWSYFIVAKAPFTSKT
jgi:hypothetical protein